jgi:hypothetical protein
VALSSSARGEKAKDGEPDVVTESFETMANDGSHLPRKAGRLRNL